MEKKIEILSQLTVDEINELRLMLSQLSELKKFVGIIETGRTPYWGDCLNQAMELKQEDYYTQFEHVTDNNPLFT